LLGVKDLLSLEWAEMTETIDDARRKAVN
jgi:hypothetical protein